MAQKAEPGAPHPRKKLYWSLAGGVVLLVVVVLVAPPVVLRVRVWRALQQTQAAEEALHGGDVAGAQQLMTSALQWWSRDARVLREAAKVAQARNDLPQTLAYWQATWAFSRDPADLRELVLAALAAQQFDFATDALAVLQKLEPANPLTWLTEARLRLALGQWPEALAAAQRVLDQDPSVGDAHLVYAEATQFSPEEAVRAAGREHLRKLATRSDLLGLQAARLLAGFNGLTVEQAGELAQQIHDHPLATRDDQLLALRLRGLLPGANDDALIQAARQLFPPGDTDGLVAVGRWLNTQGKYDQTLKIIDSQTALTRGDLFKIRLDALAKQGQWATLDEILRQPDLPLDPDLQLLFQARTLTELHRDREADLAWQRAFQAVAKEPVKLLNVALYAIKDGQDDRARPVLRELVQEISVRRAAFTQWVALEDRARHLADKYDVLTDMLKYYRSDPEVLNDWLYAGFLLGAPDDATLAQAQKLAAQYPRTLSYHVTLALGLLKTAQPEAALAAFESLPPFDWMTVEFPGWRAVAAAVLRANGRTADAAKLENTIARGDLLPEEQKLLEPPPSIHLP